MLEKFSIKLFTMLSSDFCHSAQYWVSKMPSVNTHWFQGSLIQISSTEHITKFPRDGMSILFQRWNPARFCSKDMTYYKTLLPGPFFILTKRKNLTLQTQPPFSLTTMVFFTIWSEFLSLGWLTSLLNWSSVLNYCFLGQFLNRGFSSTLEWHWPPGMCSRKA